MWPLDAANMSAVHPLASAALAAVPVLSAASSSCTSHASPRVQAEASCELLPGGLPRPRKPLLCMLQGERQVAAWGVASNARLSLEDRICSTVAG